MNKLSHTAPANWLQPEWPVSPRVHAFTTTRHNESNLETNLAHVLPEHCKPRYINQGHGATVLKADDITTFIDADATWTCNANVVCAIRSADCLPVLLADASGSVIAAVHAGWRGLAAGIISNSVAAIRPFVKSTLHAWVGPGISARTYEVGPELRDTFINRNAAYITAFHQNDNKWLCDLLALTRIDLNKAGVNELHGGNWCTFSEPERFHSYRRDKGAGRMVTLIWIQESGNVTHNRK